METIVFLIAARIIITVFVAQFGKDRKIGICGGLVVCLISPLIGLILILCSEKKMFGSDDKIQSLPGSGRFT